MRSFLAFCVPLLMVTNIVLGQKSFGREELIKVHLSPKELQNDLTYLFERIEAIHINPYTVTSRAKIYSQIRNARSKITKPMNSLEFWRIINPIVVNLYDGHTGIGLSDENVFVADFYFPFEVEFNPTKDTILIKKNLPGSGGDIPKGAKIISINGIASSQIIQDLAQNVSGEMMSYRHAIAEIGFAPLLFWVYGFENEFKVSYLSNNKVSSSIIKPIPRAAFLSNFELSMSKGTQPYYFRVLDSGRIALIEFNSFENREGFQEFLKKTFNEIRNRKIQNLIIDIRKNGGGDSNLGDDLLRYISDIPFTQYGKIVVKSSQEAKERYKYKEEEGSITEKSLVPDNLKEPHPDSVRFQGGVYVLTSNYTFSSATDLAWCIKHYDIGKLVGEETGQWGVNFGELIYTKLPNTKLNVRVAHKKFYCIGASDKSLHGATPHYKVKDDLRTEKDEVLEYTRKLISEN